MAAQRESPLLLTPREVITCGEDSVKRLGCLLSSTKRHTFAILVQKSNKVANVFFVFSALLIRGRVIKDRISNSIAYRLCLILSISCFGLSKMAAVFSLQVVLVALLLCAAMHCAALRDKNCLCKWNSQMLLNFTSKLPSNH